MENRRDDHVEPHDVLAAASVLERDGRPLDAIELLMHENRRAPDPGLEERLVSLRHRAFDALDRRPPSDLPPAVTADERHGGAFGSIPAAELTPATLRAGLARHGCVWVRGLIPPARADALARGIDHVFAGFDAGTAGAAPSTTSPWYVPFTPRPGRYRVGGRRGWVRASGAVWTVDSPRMLFELCRVLDDTGIGDIVTAHLGERPTLSANKCTLRRVPVDANTNWHQDGAFLGTDVRSVNLWLALSNCGSDAPGLEIVPRRFDTVLPPGTEGALFDWSVSPQIVAEVSRETPALSPAFEAGDALLFDHLLLHRTAIEVGMTRERYAMETWQFAPSSYPDGQIPVVY